MDRARGDERQVAFITVDADIGNSTLLRMFVHQVTELGASVLWEAAWNTSAKAKRSCRCSKSPGGDLPFQRRAGASGESPATGSHLDRTDSRYAFRHSL